MDGNPYESPQTTEKGRANAPSWLRDMLIDSLVAVAIIVALAIPALLIAWLARDS
jgi:hypothetical protein